LVGPTFEVDLITHSSLGQPEYLASAIKEYNEKRTGIMTNVGGDFAGMVFTQIFLLLIKHISEYDNVWGV
jgi:hypothetical protein